MWRYRQSSAIVAPQLIINPWLPKGVNLIVGPSGAGKNVLALQVAKAIANGERFLNHEVLHPGPVMVVCLERPGDWNQRMAQTVVHSEPKFPIRFWFHDNKKDGKVVFNEPGWARLHRKLRLLTNKERLRALFLDSLSELLPGADPGDRKAYQDFFKALRRWQRDYVDAIIVHHHTNQFGYDKLFLDQRDTRDHKVILQSSDARWFVGQQGAFRGLIIGGHVSREAQVILKMRDDYQLVPISFVSPQYRELLRWLPGWGLNFTAWEEIRTDLAEYHEATKSDTIPAQKLIEITDLRGRSVRTLANIAGYRKHRRHSSEGENPTLYTLRKHNLIRAGEHHSMKRSYMR